MTRIESDKQTIEQPSEKVFTFLSDFNNFKNLMPEQVTDWTSTSEDCRFTIKGMATLSMQYESKTPYSQVKIVKKDKAPFDFILYCNIEQDSANAGQCSLQLLFDADLNPMLKMMAVKPLKNFLNMLLSNFPPLA